MMKKPICRLLALLCMCTFFSFCGCVEKEEDGLYIYPQKGAEYLADYTEGEKSFGMTVFPFSAAVSDENFARYYAESQETVEISMGEVSRWEEKSGLIFRGHAEAAYSMYGIYVRSIGYFLASDATASDYGICLTGIPVGTYEATVFGIDGEGVLRYGAGSCYFDASRVLQPAPCRINGFFLRNGTGYEEGGALVQKTATLLAVFGEGILAEEGSFSVDVISGRGQAGILFGMGATVAETYFEDAVHYYYFSADGSEVSLSRIDGGKETVESLPLALEDGKHTFSVVRTQSGYTCSIDGEKVFETEGKNGFVGVRSDGAGASFSGAQMQTAGREETAVFAKEVLRDSVILPKYSVSSLGKDALGALVTGDFGYASSEQVRSAIETSEAAIDSAASAEEVLDALCAGISRVEGSVLARYKADAFRSLEELVIEWADLLQTEFDRTQVKQLSLAVESMSGYIETDPSAVYDGRWWIPEFYRVNALLEYAGEAIESAVSVTQVRSAYENYMVDLLKACAQKNTDIYVYYYKNYDSGYAGGRYWWYVCTYTLADGFRYAGTNETYKYTQPSDYRLTSVFYNPSDPAYSRDAETVVAQYNELVGELVNKKHRI